MANSKFDIETGSGGQLYPVMTEDPGLRWAFIRKVYSIVCLQFLLTFGVGLAMFLIQPVREFMRTQTGFFSLIGIIIVTVILCILMHVFGKRHPWNYVILILFTIGMAFMVGAVSSLKKGETVLLAAGFTLLTTVSLTLFTFFAAKRGFDFKFMGPFLFVAALLLMAFGIMRIIFPMGNLVNLAIGCMGALVFSGFIIYDTDNIIKRFDYDEYGEAAMCLFLDIINLFLYMLEIVGFK